MIPFHRWWYTASEWQSEAMNQGSLAPKASAQWMIVDLNWKVKDDMSNFIKNGVCEGEWEVAGRGLVQERKEFSVKNRDWLYICTLLSRFFKGFLSWYMSIPAFILQIRVNWLKSTQWENSDLLFSCNKFPFLDVISWFQKSRSIWIKALGVERSGKNWHF